MVCFENYFSIIAACDNFCPNNLLHKSSAAISDNASDTFPVKNSSQISSSDELFHITFSTQ